MKFLFDMPDSEALPRTYDLMEEVGAFAKEAKLVEANREVAADTTQEESGKRAIMGMLRKMYKDFPEKTAELCGKFWVLDDGETVPTVNRTVTKIITNPNALDFFILAFALVQ